MLFVQNVRWVTVIWWYPGINRYPRRWVNGTRSYICLPQKAHFLIFYDFKSVRAGSKKIEETTSGKSCPKSHYFAPIGVSSLVLGYLLTSFGLPFMLNFLTLRNHIFCNSPKSYILQQVPSESSNFTTQRLRLLYQLLIRIFFLFQGPSLVDFIFILYWFLTKMVYLESRFGPSGRPKSVIWHPVSSKVVIFGPPVRWVMAKDVFISQPVRWVTVSSTHRE